MDKARLIVGTTLLVVAGLMVVNSVCKFALGKIRKVEA